MLNVSRGQKVDKFLKIRNKIAKIYNKELKNLPIKLPLLEKNVYSSFHLYVILLKTKNRDLLYKEFLKKGFKTNVHYIPIYKHPYFKKLKFNIKNFQNNEIYFKNALSIPISPSLTEKNILSIVKILKNFFKK